MTLLQEDLDLEFGNGLALSSDQQKGLIYAIKNVLPYAEHRMCARHIWSNLRKRHGESGNLHGLFGSVQEHTTRKFLTEDSRR